MIKKDKETTAYMIFMLGVVVGVLLMIPATMMYKTACDDEYNTRIKAFAYDQAERNKQLTETECVTILEDAVIKYETELKDPKEM